MSLARSCAIVPEILYDAPEDIEARSILTRFQDAIAVAFVQTTRIGMIVTVRGGKGCLVKKMPDGSWSPPCALMFGGPAIGAAVGVEIADMIIFMNTEQAVNAFLGNNAGIGVSGGLSLGPIGRSGEVMLTTGSKKGFIVYSTSKGLFGGVNLEFSGIVVDHTANKVYYQKDLLPEDILAGKVAIPKGESFDSMYKALRDVTEGARQVAMGATANGQTTNT